MFFAPTPPYVAPTSFMDIITHLGSSAGVQFVIDAGDAASYPGTGQSVQDLSPSNFDWQLGSTSGVDTEDPTFVGVAGRQSSGEYFRSIDYEDDLRALARSTFTDSLHQNNALYSYVGWVRMAYHDPTFGSAFFKTVVAAGTRGISIGDSIAANQLSASVTDAASAQVGSIVTGLSMPVNAWTFVAIAHDEAAGTWRAQRNADVASGSGATYTSPEAGASGAVPRICMTNDPSGGYSGDNAMVAMWNRMLSAAEIMALYNATKGRFGL